MLTGKELGAALETAIKLKSVTKKAVAAEFGVRPPSVQDWIKYGRIDKKHLNHLVDYFSDVVPPAHWGIPNTWQCEFQDESAMSTPMEAQADRVKQLLIARGVAPRKIRTSLANACGITYQSVTDWFDGSSRTITAENLAAIAMEWDANVVWLINGSGPMDSLSGRPGAVHPTMIRLYEAAKASRKIPGDSPQAELSRLLNVSPQRINNWEARGVSKQGLLDAQAVIGCNAKWIESGTGEMFLGGQDHGVSEPPATPYGQELFSIPQYNTGGAGGAGVILRDQPGVIQKWSVTSDWLRSNVPHCTSPKNLCIVTGFGDSMPEIYSPGDPVLVDTGITLCDHDGIYFFGVGEEGFIKRLQRIPGQGIRVLSQNREYEPWTINQEMDFRVFGKVLRAWKGRPY